MTRDRQLRHVSVEAARSKQKLGQALNAKEFAVLAGLSYSVAREWFHLRGFPSVRGMVFWEDFVIWRRTQNRGNSLRTATDLIEGKQSETNAAAGISSPPIRQMPFRAAKILAEA